jgi:hypothetical protein
MNTRSPYPDIEVPEISGTATPLMLPSLTDLELASAD